MATFDEYIKSAAEAESQDEAVNIAILAILEALKDLTGRIEDLESFVRDVKYGRTNI